MRSHDFEAELIRMVKALREELAQVESLTNFKLEIKVEGRVNDGDVKIEFSLGQYYSIVCSGGSLDATVEEFLRRHGWNNRHQPLCLPKVEPQAVLEPTQIEYSDGSSLDASQEIPS